MTKTTYSPKPTRYVIKNGVVTSTILSRRIVADDGLSCVDIVSKNLYGTPTIAYYYERDFVIGVGSTIDEAIKVWRTNYAARVTWAR